MYGSLNASSCIVISCLESGRFGKKDFYRMDNYVLRLKPEAVKKLVHALRMKFNSPVRHAGKFYSWDTLIRLKAQELASYVLCRRTDLDFSEPEPVLHRTDSEAIRSGLLQNMRKETGTCHRIVHPILAGNASASPSMKTLQYDSSNVQVPQVPLRWI